MGRKVLVSLVSDQTIPNLELIKEFYDEIDEYIFISTKQMKSQLKWIVNASKLQNYKEIEVNAFDMNDIETKLNNFGFEDNEYLVNITGGTKLMILIVDDFFRKIGAKIIYVTGYKKQYIKVFPSVGKREFLLETKLTLNEYLTAYGFEIKASDLFKSKIDALKMLEAFLSIPEELLEYFSKLQERRGDNTTIGNIDGLQNFLDKLIFTPTNPNKLTKYETRYITGDWFEEWVYYKVKNELNLNDNEIGIGYQLLKDNVPNELDVLFIYEHKLYIIECKTSFYHLQKEIIEIKGEKKENLKKRNLLPEIIYKSDSLRSKFGLFADTSIFTLGLIKDESGNILKEHSKHIERAELSRIKIISRKDILDNLSIKDLLKIH